MPLWLSVCGSLLALSEVAHAFIAFQPTCDGPTKDDKFNYVLSPSVRGTTDILWSCFAVMLLCTWSIQHLSVPDPRQAAKERHKIPNDTEEEGEQNQPKSLRRRAALMAFKFLAKIFRAKQKPRLWNEFLDESHWNLLRLQGMGLCILAPEYYLGKALAENSSANASRDQFKDEENWATAHAFFADMRGLILKFETTAVETDLVPTKAGSEEGRKRHRPYPGGEPTPYMEQNEEEAMKQEWEDCWRLHGQDCPYRLKQERTRSKGSDSTHNTNDVQEHGPNALANGPQATQKAEVEEMIEPLDLEKLPQPLHISTSELPRDFSCQTTAVASSGSQPGHQWGRPSPSSPMITEEKEAKERHPQKEKEETYITSSIEPPVMSPSAFLPFTSLDQSSTSTQESHHRLLPHPPWTGLWALSSLQMHHARDIGLIPPPPYISLSSLKDQSKSDAMVKALAIWQLLWLTTQVLARAATDLPITLLEITVLAFSATSMITYILLWHKPQHVRCPTYIPALRPLTRADVVGLAARAPVSTMLVHEFWLHGVNVRAMGDSVFPWPRGVSLYIPKFLKTGRGAATATASNWIEIDSVFVGMGLGGAVFGAIHFAAWNFAFPTPVERLLWRISCGIIVGFPVLMSLIYILYLKWTEEEREAGGGDSWTNRVLRRFGHATVPVYFLARLYLLVEVFRSLAYSPPEAFQSISWPTMVPHYS